MDICLKNPFAFSQTNEQPTEAELEELVKAFWGKEMYKEFEYITALPQLLLGYVALELPPTEQTMINVCRLNNSVALAIRKEYFMAIDKLFEESDFKYVRGAYKEFIRQTRANNNRMEYVNKVDKRLTELGYIFERNDYFVEF